MVAKQIDVKDDDYIKPEIIQSFINKFNKATAGTIARHTKESLNWFRARVSKDLRFNRQRFLKNGGDYVKRKGNEGRTLIGRLYFFEYEAVEAGDKENGVYDKYPMVFVFNTSTSALGHKLVHALNMHYLQPRERAIVYLKLMKVRNKKGWSNATKLKISWDIIKALVDHKLYEKAVHSYRVDRIQSKLLEIHSEDWEIATFLRMEQFIKIEDGSMANQQDIRKAHREKSRR
jgi:hypothetical protein